MTCLSTIFSTAFIRVLLSSLLGIAVTVMLLWTMDYLITSTDTMELKLPRGRPLEFIRAERKDPPPTRRERSPEQPPLPPPEAPAPSRFEPPIPRVDKMPIGSVNVAAEVDVSSDAFNLGVSEGDYLPLVKISPIYPPRALARGIEGWVMLEFTVTENGAVTDIRVIDSQPKSKIFHRASIDAASRWKYKPRVIDGNAVAVQGVRHKITFKIKK